MPNGLQNDKSYKTNIVIQLWTLIFAKAAECFYFYSTREKAPKIGPVKHRKALPITGSTVTTCINPTNRSFCPYTFKTQQNKNKDPLRKHLASAAGPFAYFITLSNKDW